MYIHDMHVPLMSFALDFQKTHFMMYLHLHICGCFTSMVSIFNFSASPPPTHRCNVTHHHVLRAHKIVCVWFVMISIRFRCILWGGGSDDRGPSLAVGQGFDSIPNL